MISSAKGENTVPWINPSQSADGYENSLGNILSSISLSSTHSGIGSRPPDLSTSSLSTFEEDSGHKIGEFFGNSAVFAPISPPSVQLKKTKDYTMNLSKPFNAESGDCSQRSSPPILAMNQISLNQHLSSPLQSHTSLHHVGTQRRGTQKEIRVEACSSFDNSDYPHIQSEVLLEKAKDDGHLSCFSYENYHCLHPRKYEVVTQDHRNYDSDPGGAVFKVLNKNTKPADLAAPENYIGAEIDTSNKNFGEDGRMSSTIRSSYSPLINMGSVDEHEQFLENSSRTSSLGYSNRSGSNFDHNSQKYSGHFREASLGQGFQDKSSLPCAGGNVDYPYDFDHTQQGHSNPAFDSLSKCSSSDEIYIQRVNDVEYSSKCTPPLTPSPDSDSSPFHQDYPRFDIATENFQHAYPPPRQRVLSADGISNRYHCNFQKQGYDSNSRTNDPVMQSRHSPDLERIECNFDCQEKNRPRSYSSGTNMNEYVRSQGFPMQTPQLSGFSENNKLPQQADISTLHQSSDRIFFAPNTAMYTSHHQAQRHDYNNVGGVVEANVRQGLNPHFLSASIGFDEFNMNSLSQLVEISHIHAGVTPIDSSMSFVRNSSKNGNHSGLHNSSNEVEKKHRKEANMNALSQNFANADSLDLYQAKNALPKARPKFVYNVKFKRTHRHFILGQRVQQDVQIGSYVIVEADRGEDLGMVISSIASGKVFSGSRLSCRQSTNSSTNCDMNSSIGDSGSDKSISSSGGNKDLKRILRLATHDEILLLAVKEEEEEELLRVCKEKIAQRGLPMNAIDAEYQFDRHKLTFFFEAEGRVDFRELVRDLFSIYKTRIWMQQVDKGASGPGGTHTAENPNRITYVDGLPKECGDK